MNENGALGFEGFEVEVLEMPQQPPERSSEAKLLLTTGLASSLFGIVLSVGGALSWKIGQIAQGFSYLGLHGGVLIMGGLTLVGMGMLRRGLAAQLSSQARPEVDPAQNKLAAEIDTVRLNVLKVGDQQRQMRDVLDRLESTVLTQAQYMEQLQHYEGEPRNDDAIFRMAANLDQMWAKLDQRLQSEHSRVSQNLEHVRSFIESALQSLDGRSQAKLGEVCKSLEASRSSLDATCRALAEQLQSEQAKMAHSLQQFSSAIDSARGTLEAASNRIEQGLTRIEAQRLERPAPRPADFERPAPRPAETARDLSKTSRIPLDVHRQNPQRVQKEPLSLGMLDEINEPEAPASRPAASLDHVGGALPSEEQITTSGRTPTEEELRDALREMRRYGNP